MPLAPRCVLIALNVLLLSSPGVIQQRFGAGVHPFFIATLLVIAVNVLLLIAGSMMDIFSALVVVAPLIVPIARIYEVDLIHLGIIFVLNLEIGFAHPPLGINLFIASSYF